MYRVEGGLRRKRVGERGEGGGRERKVKKLREREREREGGGGGRRDTCLPCMTSRLHTHT